MVLARGIDLLWPGVCHCRKIKLDFFFSSNDVNSWWTERPVLAIRLFD